MKFPWKSQHKVSSLIAVFFLTMFCLSGIILNHKRPFQSIDISRSLLPPFYRHSSWNGGLMRGSEAFLFPDSTKAIAVYGTSGIWLTDPSNGCYEDFNRGIPEGSANRNIRALACDTLNSRLFAASTNGLYSRTLQKNDSWHPVDIGLGHNDNLSDFFVSGDTLLALSRSHLIISYNGGATFRHHTLPSAADEESPETSLFKIIWLFHSGQLFGSPGALIADFFALSLIFLCITGLCLWICPKFIKHRAQKGLKTTRTVTVVRLSRKSHNLIGVWCVLFCLLIAFTGWLLRPPGLLALVNIKTPVPSATVLDNPNPWQDKLRMIRHDSDGAWILSTAQGFYRLRSLDSVPEKIIKTPPVSVMGLNVWEKDKDGNWICGSFSGLYTWSIKDNKIKDYFSGEECEAKPGPPFGKMPVSGFSSDFPQGYTVVTYDNGCLTDHDLYAPPQPEYLRDMPMSLWNIALEVHTGRIFFGNSATYYYVFIFGGAVLWSLISGFFLHLQRKRTLPKNQSGKKT